MTEARQIYLDYNATAPVRPEVRDAVVPLLFGDSYGNASSIHWAGRDAKKHLEDARRRVAAILDRKPSEIIFTSGGTEADNLALYGPRPTKLIVSAVEHPAVMEAADALEARGVQVIRIGVDASGRLDLDALDTALKDHADGPANPRGTNRRRGQRRSPSQPKLQTDVLVSVMAVNNETGVISPIDEVIARGHAVGATVHVDAVQAAGRIALPTEADMITISGHKLGAIKGVGALAIREALPLDPVVRGGAQERGRRAGTEPVGAAVALAVALELAVTEREVEQVRLAELRDRLEAAIDTLDGTRILGRDAPRIANTSTALFDDVEGESLVIALDLAGIAVSSGSACASGSLEPSHVALAMGIPADRALSAVRFSLGWGTTRADIDSVAGRLGDLLAQVRAA